MQQVPPEGETPFRLGLFVGGSLDQEELFNLQVNLFHGWMDKFRSASPECTDEVLDWIPTPSVLWGLQHVRTGT